MCPGMQSISFHRNLHQAKWVQRGSVSESHQTKWIEDLAKVYSARSGFQVSNLSENWQVAWQHCCQATCQVSKGLEHFNIQYCRFETLQDLAIRHNIVYWHGLYFGLWSYFVCVCVFFFFLMPNWPLHQNDVWPQQIGFMQGANFQFCIQKIRM